MDPQFSISKLKEVTGSPKNDRVRAQFHVRHYRQQCRRRVGDCVRVLLCYVGSILDGNRFL